MSLLHEAMTLSSLKKRVLSVYSGWPQARAAQDFRQVPSVPLLRGLLSQQNARFRELTDRSRIPTLEINWLEACQNTAQIRTGVFVRGIPCDFNGWLVGSNKQDIIIDTQIYETFDIPAEIFDNTYTRDEMFQIGYARAVKNLLEKLNAHSLANVIQWAGVNGYKEVIGVDGGVDAASAWKKTKIPYGNTYADSLNPYLDRVVQRNKFLGARVYEGGVLRTNLDNDNPTGDVMVFGNRRVVSDPNTFAAQSVDRDMFVIADGAIAMFTVNNQSREGTDYGVPGNGMIGLARELGDFRDSNGNPLVVDIYVLRKKRTMDSTDYLGLNTDNRCEFVDSYRLEVNFKQVLNPTACGDKTTGIVQITTDRSLPTFIAPGEIQRTVAYNPATPSLTY